MFRSEEHTSELQSLRHLVCRLLLEKKKRVPCPRPIEPSHCIQHARALCCCGHPVFMPGGDVSNGKVRVPYPRVIEPIFFFNDTATTEIYTLSLHDALPI